MKLTKIFLLLLCAINIIITAFPAFAQTKGLIVTPQRVVFEGRDRVKELTLVNRGDQKQRYRISLVNRKMLEDGNLEEVNSPAKGEFFASDHVRYSPRTIELEPRSPQKIRIMSRLPAGASEGEYRSHLLIQEIPEAGETQSITTTNSDGLSINVRAIFGITLPVILRRGELEAKVTLSNASIIRENDQTFARFTINRDGNKSIMGTAKVYANGKIVGLLKGVSAYLSNKKRIVYVPINEEFENNLNGPIRIEYSADGDLEDTPDAEILFNS